MTSWITWFVRLHALKTVMWLLVSKRGGQGEHSWADTAPLSGTAPLRGNMPWSLVESQLNRGSTAKRPVTSHPEATRPGFLASGSFGHMDWVALQLPFEVVCCSLSRSDPKLPLQFGKDAAQSPSQLRNCSSFGKPHPQAKEENALTSQTQARAFEEDAGLLGGKG